MSKFLLLKHRYLIIFSLLLGGIVGCGSLNSEILEQVPSPISSSPTTTLANAETLSNIEKNIHKQVNEYRKSKNLPPLTLNEQITQQAKLHSKRMSAGLVPFSHDGFEERIEKVGFLIPYKSAAENIAINQGSTDPATVAVEGWLKSKEHLQNIKGDFDLTGIGVAQDNNGKFYLTQIFLKKATSNSSIPSSTPKSSSEANNTSLATLEKETHEKVNQYRLSLGLSPLELDSRVSQEAREFSQKMASKKATFSHDGFEGRAKAIGQFLSYAKVGENLAYMKGYSDPATIAVQGWIDSPGHRENMEGDYNVTGMGIAKNKAGEYYFTQLFVKKR